MSLSSRQHLHEERKNIAPYQVCYVFSSGILPLRSHSGVSYSALPYISPEGAMRPRASCFALQIQPLERLRRNKVPSNGPAEKNKSYLSVWDVLYLQIGARY